MGRQAEGTMPPQAVYSDSREMGKPMAWQMGKGRGVRVGVWVEGAESESSSVWA